MPHGLHSILLCELTAPSQFGVEPGDGPQILIGQGGPRPQLLLSGHDAVRWVHTRPAADRTTDLAQDPKSVGRRARTTAAGLTYIFPVEKATAGDHAALAASGDCEIGSCRRQLKTEQGVAPEI